MVIKTIFMLGMLFIPLLVVMSGIVTSTPLLFLLYMISGLGTAGVGMGVMHDAIHGSYSKNPRLNRILGYTMNLIGANDEVWRVQHNVLHHSYTNINEHDDDLNAPSFLRFSPHVEKKWMHRFQHYYTWFFYGLSTISWVTTKDFIRLTRYYKMGLLGNRNAYIYQIFRIILWKLVYFSYMLVLPALLSPFSFWMIFLAFLSSHFITGLSMSVVFQTAHIMPETEYPLPDTDGQIESERLIHQMATTSNYAPKSRIFSWLIGGLNYQVEHHLFPNICHVHYRKIAPIIQETAEEFGVPYLYKETFIDAVIAHYRMLRHLGRNDNLPALQPVSRKVEQPFTQEIR